MATAPGKFEWLVILPDQPGKLEKRLEVRPFVYPLLSPSPFPTISTNPSTENISKASNPTSKPDSGRWVVCFPIYPTSSLFRHFEDGRKADENAGAILDEVPTENSGLKFKGSAMVALASSKEEVLEKLKADIYGRSEVWDFSKVSFVARVLHLGFRGWGKTGRLMRE